MGRQLEDIQGLPTLGVARMTLRIIRIWCKDGVVLLWEAGGLFKPYFLGYN